MPSIHVIAVGPFGRAVADRLAELTGADVTTEPTRPAIRVLAAWRRVPDLERDLDERSFRERTPWLPVVLEHPVLRVGPAVVPGAGPCHGCYQRRVAQHAPDRAVAEALERRYVSDPDAGPVGHLPPAALLAAGLALRAVRRLALLPVAEAGRVRRIDLLTQQTGTGRAVGVHGCVHCGLHRDERERSHAELRSVLPEVLTWAA